MDATAYLQKHGISMREAITGCAEIVLIDRPNPVRVLMSVWEFENIHPAVLETKFGYTLNDRKALAERFARVKRAHGLLGRHRDTDAVAARRRAITKEISGE